MNFKEIIESQDKVELGLHLKRYLETGMVMRDKKYLEVKELMKMLGEWYQLNIFITFIDHQAGINVTLPSLAFDTDNSIASLKSAKVRVL